MSHTGRITLKVFWEAVEERLTACSAEELRAILRAMAQEVPPPERESFLEKLDSVEDTAFAARQAIQQEDLLTDIDDLIFEIHEIMEQADPWEERHGWGEYYDDEDSLGPYEEFVEPLTGLFDRAGAAFDYGNLSLARTAHQKLFEMLTFEDDYGRGVRTYDLTSVDMGEACARYLRAVHGTEPPELRPHALFEQMRQARSWLGRPRPTLDDLVQISPQPLPDQEQFLVDWIAFLRTQSERDTDALLREAVRLSQGTQGLEALARTEGKERPRAYLDWFTALEQEGNHHKVLLAAQEALQTLPAGLPIRAAIADHLCAVAARLGDAEGLRFGRWEAFLAKPTLSRLLDLWDGAPTDGERRAVMRQAAQHVQGYLAQRAGRGDIPGLWRDEDNLERPALISTSVLAHTYLLGEEFDAAHQLVVGDKVLGWSSSSSSQGLVVSFFLALLSGKAVGTLPPNLAQLWESRLQYSVGSWMDREEGEEPVHKRLARVYAEQMTRVSLGNSGPERVLPWCLDVARQRATAIVSNQFRKSYGKAAVLTTACAEMLQLRRNKEAAASFVEGIRTSFPRHSAFQSQLRAAIQRMENGLR